MENIPRSLGGVVELTIGNTTEIFIPHVLRQYIPTCSPVWRGISASVAQNLCISSPPLWPIGGCRRHGNRIWRSEFLLGEAWTSLFHGFAVKLRNIVR